MKDLWLRLRALFLRQRIERELDDELDFHIEMQVRKNVAAGMPEAEARRRARIEFGGDALVKEQCRDQRRVNFIETLFQDVRYAIRGFRKTPLFALTVVGTIALGLGINTAVFTLFNAYVLRPIAIRDPYSLYELSCLNRNGSFALAPDLYERVRKDNPALLETFAIRNLEIRVNGRVAYGELVSGNYFRALGVGAAMGRTILPEDSSAPGREPVTVLSFGAWQNMFASDPDILGKKVMVHGFPLEVIGVAPQGFTGMTELAEDFWAPLSMTGQIDPDRGVWLRVFGRLRPDMTLQQANAALSVLAQVMTANLPDKDKATGAVLRSRATNVPLSRDAVLLMSPVIAAFGMILLIACANVANMMLARAMARQREIGIRLSLGAARARLIRQLLTESILLALPAAALGFVVSQGTISAGVRFVFTMLPAEFLEYLRVVPMPPDFRVFTFMMMAALIAAVAFGLAPALQATRASVIQAARGDFTSDHRPTRLRNTLVILQISGSVLLLICTGVLLRSANRMRAFDPGLDTNHSIEIQVQEKSRARALAVLNSDPLVETVGASLEVPLDSSFPVAYGVGFYDYVSPEFFQIFGIPILQGRNFTVSEALAGAPVALVTQALSSRLFPTEGAIGKSIHLAPDTSSSRRGTLRHSDVRVIGIVRDINSSVRDDIGRRCYIFFPTAATKAGNTILVRVRGDPDAARRKIDTALAAATPGAVDEIHSMRMFIVGRVVVFRMAYWISAAVGALALILSVSGIYGVLSYLVMQRRKEIGIRMALGASERRMVGLVLAQSIRLTAFGLIFGTSAALGISRLLAARLESIETFDAGAYSVAIGLVFISGLIAAAVPSRKAARIDPIATLRAD